MDVTYIVKVMHKILRLIQPVLKGENCLVSRLRKNCNVGFLSETVGMRSLKLCMITSTELSTVVLVTLSQILRQHLHLKDEIETCGFFS